MTELVKRGVKVTCFTTEDFRRIVEPTGVQASADAIIKFLEK